MTEPVPTSTPRTLAVTIALVIGLLLVGAAGGWLLFGSLASGGEPAPVAPAPSSPAAGSSAAPRVPGKGVDGPFGGGAPLPAPRGTFTPDVTSR